MRGEIQIMCNLSENIEETGIKRELRRESRKSGLTL